MIKLYEILKIELVKFFGTYLWGNLKAIRGLTTWVLVEASWKKPLHYYISRYISTDFLQQVTNVTHSLKISFGMWIGRGWMQVTNGLLIRHWSHDGVNLRRNLKVSFRVQLSRSNSSDVAHDEVNLVIVSILEIFFSGWQMWLKVCKFFLIWKWEYIS